jgi:hypothetical protein
VTTIPENIDRLTVDRLTARVNVWLATALVASVRSRFSLTHSEHKSAKTASLFDAVYQGFIAATLEAKQQPEFADELEAAEFGRQAFLNELARHRRTSRIGPSLSSAEVTELLGISRQALSKRVAAGSVVALNGPHSTANVYPEWQFDVTKREVRDGVRQVVAAFREALEHDYSPETLAIWMTTPNSAFEANLSPADWLAQNGSPAIVISLAEETAAGLAQ